MEGATLVNKKENPIREGKQIKILLKTHKRCTDAKTSLGMKTFDDLFNWLLEQVGQ